MGIKRSYYRLPYFLKHLKSSGEESRDQEWHATLVLRQQVRFAKMNWENLFYSAILFSEDIKRC